MTARDQPDTVPVTDAHRNVVTDDDIARAFTANWALGTRIWGDSLGGRSMVGNGFVATTVDRPAFIVNAVVLLEPLEPDAVPDVMVALDDFYGFSRGTDTGRVFLFSVWGTPDLTAYGWDGRRHPPLMHRPAGDRVPATPAGLTVERVQDAADLRAAERVTASSFGLADPVLHQPEGLFGRGLVEESRMPVWVAKDGDRVVSTAATCVAHGVNNIVNVATLPAARGRGYGSAVTWPATIPDPSLPAVLVASELGAPVYARMGFRTVRPITAWSRTTGPGSPTAR